MDCEAENGRSTSENLPSASYPISDSIIFKYCLGSLDERRNILKGLSFSSSDEHLENFGKQVSLFSGCSHHWHQIKITKKLMEEGIQAWAFLSQETNRVLWANLVPIVNQYFMKISLSSRPLALQDIEFLRRISGVEGTVYQENFERLWSWLYPVARTLSHSSINATWNSLQGRNWIRGFVAKEEAEKTLERDGNFHPGTFLLRFPSSRSWPHPDAGALVATYVGGDYAVRHRILSLDFLHDSASSEEGPFKPLHEMLVEEQELSRPVRRG